MKKKVYSKPILVAERFEPQEYCANCNDPFQNYDTHIYLDLINKTIFDSSEFMDSYGQLSGSVPDGVYKDVQIYYLKRSPYKTGTLTKQMNAFYALYNHAYTTSIFTLNGAEAPRYQFVENGIRDVKVINRKVYFNAS